jgi:NAD(P)-dependent dehydrogenase (short-subunit alcohol dehydrogenase family)
MSNSDSKGTALITGASTGIGAVYADRLAKRGYDLILVARNEARLKALAARLTKETGRLVTPLLADLANVERVLREDQAITMLVNNAGLGAVRPLLDTDVDEMDELIALNVTALTRLTYTFAWWLTNHLTGLSKPSNSNWGNSTQRYTSRLSQGETCIEYDRPSSLFGQFADERVGPMAAALDQKLEDLAATATR